MERVVQRLAEEQAKMSREVHVITSTLRMQSGPKEESINGVHIHRAKAIRFHYPDLAYPMECPERVLEQSDVVHVHSQNSLFNIVLAKRAKRIGRPLVIDFVALDYLKMHRSFLIRFFGGYYQDRVQRKALRLADDVITINRRDHGILKDTYGVESKVVPHGIDEKYLTKPKDDRVFREKYGVYSRNVVAFIGRVHPSKGMDNLIEALSFVVHEVDDFILAIAGGGSESYKEKLSKLARKLGVENYVRFLGYITEDEKISLLDSAKAFVLPTRHAGENYSLVIDEAYARGVPVVVTNMGVLPYRVKHLETGILVPPGDTSSLARALTALLKDDNLFARLCKELQKAKESLLTWSQVQRRVDNIYKDVLSRRAKS